MALQEEFKSQGDFLFKHRSYLPLIILILGLAVFIQTEQHETHALESHFSESYEWLCLTSCLLGFLIRILTVGHTPKNTSGRNTKAGQIADQLNTIGMYSIVRHPLYVGNFFMWLGIAMLTENLWFIIAFILAYAFYYERIMYAEETFLRAKFGSKYIAWSSHVPAFIPRFKNYHNNEYPFQYKKVLKKEKNGLAAIFLLFWLFEFVGDIIEHERLVIEFNFWFFAAISATIIYVILKILKKTSKLNT